MSQELSTGSPAAQAAGLATSRQGGNTTPPGSSVRGTEHYQTKNWVATLFAKEPPIFDPTAMQYLAYGREHTKEGRQHWQIFVVFHCKKSSYKRVAACFHPTIRAHVEPMRGTIDQNEKYCSKEGEYTEHGTKPRPGTRTDIHTAVQSIIEGTTTADDVLEQNPDVYNRASRTLERAEQIRMGRMYRTEMTEGIWIYGPTGKGKTHWAYNMSGYTMDQIHTQQASDKWWDHYRQQPCVVLNEFRGQMQYGDLLQLVDKWPYNVDRRYKGPIPFTSKTVIITSPNPPHKVYKNLDKGDSIAQLLRRFKVFHIDDLMKPQDRPSA